MYVNKYLSFNFIMGTTFKDKYTNHTKFYWWKFDVLSCLIWQFDRAYFKTSLTWTFTIVEWLSGKNHICFWNLRSNFIHLQEIYVFLLPRGYTSYYMYYDLSLNRNGLQVVYTCSKALTGKVWNMTCNCSLTPQLII